MTSVTSQSAKENRKGLNFSARKISQIFQKNYTHTLLFIIIQDFTSFKEGPAETPKLCLGLHNDSI